MRVDCETATFGRALELVSRAVSTRTALPVLGTILLEALDDSLRLTATNLELSLMREIEAVVEREGATAVPARLLTDFVGNLEGGRLRLSDDGTTETLAVSAEGFDTHIRCLPAAEFPPGPAPEGTDAMRLPAPLLVGAINDVAPSASSDEARPVLTGVLMQVREGRMALIATNGYRLAVRRLAVDAGALGDLDLIVPARSLSELARALKDELAEVEIAVSAQRNQVFCRAAGFELSSRLIDGTYPRYEQVIPSGSTTVVHAPVAELARRLRGVSLFARDAANVIRLEVDGRSLVLSAETTEVGDARSPVAASVEGADTRVAFNARYLLDGLSVLTGEAEIHLDGPLSPGVLRRPGTDDFVYVVMPVRAFL